jgi:ribose transport system substrate-binding protein
MAGARRNGVDAAIALLLALVAHDGEAKAAELRREIGAPRASFHRIVRTLAAAGLVEAPRGLVRVGPLAKNLIAAHAQAVRREDELRGPRSTRPYRHPAVSRAAEASETGLIGLSRPAPAHRAARSRFRIGFANASMTNPWRVALVHGIEYAAANLGDRIERLTILHARDDARQQQADIAEMMAQGVDGLIVSAAAAEMTGDAIHEAMARGIAVVLVDRGVDPSVPRTSFVTTDDGAIGRLTALWLAERLRGNGSIVLLPGDSAAEPARMRLASAQAVFAEFPGIEVLATRWTGWRREVGREIMHDAIDRWGSNISGVWCDSGLQGAGSLQAFSDAHFRAGEIPPHTGGDLNLAYKLAIRSETPLAAVDYPPSMGIKALEVLLTSLQGCWTPSSVKVASEVIVTKGAATRSVRPDRWAEDHVRWDLPDDLILASGLGPAYNPRSFRIHYPGNVYNRSAAQSAPRRA